LYLLAALAADYTGIQRLVFTERAGRFIGMTSPAATRDALAAVYPEVDTAYRESIPQPQQSVQLADQKLVMTLNNFRQRLSMLKPGGEVDVKVNVRRDLLIGWLGNTLNTESVPVESTHEFDLPLLTSRILERPSAFVVLVQNGQLMRAVDRLGLAVHIAQTVVKQQLKHQ
jgi:hypothetical protein